MARIISLGRINYSCSDVIASFRTLLTELRKPMAITILQSFIVDSFLVAVAIAATCYDGQGDQIYGTQICNPSAPISTCCDQADNCLSNGLCLDAGGNNLIVQQGCTDANWSPPCYNYCKSTRASSLVLENPFVAIEDKSLIVYRLRQNTFISMRRRSRVLLRSKLFLL
jgi:hypothetical protein